MPGFRCQGRVKREHFADGQQRICGVVVLSAVLLFRGKPISVVVVDFQFESARSHGNGTANSSHAEDAKCFSSEISSQHAGWCPGFPTPLANHCFTLGGPSGRTKHQHHGEVGGCRIQDPGRIRDDDAACVSCTNINMLITHGKRRDCSNSRGQTLNDVRSQLVCSAYQQCLAALRTFDQGFSVIRGVVRIENRIKVSGEARQHGVRQFPGDENSRLVRHFNDLLYSTFLFIDQRATCLVWCTLRGL